MSETKKHRRIVVHKSFLLYIVDITNDRSNMEVYMKQILVSTRLEEPTYKAVQALAQQQDRKVAFLVRKAVEQFVQVAGKPRGSATQSSKMVISRKEGG